MSLLLNKPEIRGQVLVSYSEERKREMIEAHEKSCPATASLVKGRMDELGIKVERLMHSSNKQGCADIIIQFVANKEDLQHLNEAMKNLKKKDVGIWDISLFLLRK